MLTRNRSTCGVTPYIRATCNPDPDSWVAELIDWWIGEDGYPIPERQGKLRYFMIDRDQYIWGDTKEEVIKNGWHVLEELVTKSGIDASEFVKSITFIGGSIYKYDEVEQETFHAFLESESHGKYYNANIKSQPEKYPASCIRKTNKFYEKNSRCDYCGYYVLNNKIIYKEVFTPNCNKELPFCSSDCADKFQMGSEG